MPPKVVVQPDFSIILIGMNPAPAVELAPFCERVKGHVGQGSMIFRITPRLRAQGGRARLAGWGNPATAPQICQQ